MEDVREVSPNLFFLACREAEGLAIALLDAAGVVVGMEIVGCEFTAEPAEVFGSEIVP